MEKLIVFIIAVFVTTAIFYLGNVLYYLIRRKYLIYRGKACILCDGWGYIIFPDTGYSTCPQCKGKGWYETSFSKKVKRIHIQRKKR